MRLPLSDTRSAAQRSAAQRNGPAMPRYFLMRSAEGRLVERAVTKGLWPVTHGCLDRLNDAFASGELSAGSVHFGAGWEFSLQLPNRPAVSLSCLLTVNAGSRTRLQPLLQIAGLVALLLPDPLQAKTAY